MNEAGLTISAHTFTESVYQPKPPLSSKTPAWPFFTVPPRLLRAAATTQQAVDMLKSVAVVTARFQKLGGGCHWGISDAQGHSVVVEYIEGKLMVYNNSIGVMTNDPGYPWHIQNLNTHVNLQQGWPNSNDDLQISTMEGMVPRVVGHGFNLAGLPGDSSPPARFVRMFYLRQYALASLPVSSEEEAIAVAQGLINNVHLVKGTVARASKYDGVEQTPFAVLKIPSTRVFMFRTYTNMQWNKIDLTKIDFSTSSDAFISAKLSRDLNIKDVTDNFQPSSVESKVAKL